MKDPLCHSLIFLREISLLVRSCPLRFQAQNLSGITNSFAPFLFRDLLPVYTTHESRLQENLTRILSQAIIRFDQRYALRGLREPHLS